MSGRPERRPVTERDKKERVCIGKLMRVCLCLVEENKLVRSCTGSIVRWTRSGEDILLCSVYAQAEKEKQTCRGDHKML
jgi:hypothetical protein